jgi:hypothetical protein
MATRPFALEKQSLVILHPCRRDAGAPRITAFWEDRLRAKGKQKAAQDRGRGRSKTEELLIYFADGFTCNVFNNKMNALRLPAP